MIPTAHRRIASALAAALLSAASLTQTSFAAPTNAPPRSTVGVEGRIDLVAPGAPLEARAVDPRAAIQIRIASSEAAGADRHYDLRYIGLEPGRHDLRPFLQRVDGSSISDLPPILVTIDTLLPPLHNGLLLEHRSLGMPALGGYRVGMTLAISAWLLAGLALWLRGRRPLAPPLAPAPIPRPSFAQILRPLVERAASGEATTEDQAQLERLLLSHWCARLHLEGESPSIAIRRLKEHPEAGALLRTLEQWLHDRPGRHRTDIATVLRPYLQDPK